MKQKLNKPSKPLVKDSIIEIDNILKSNINSTSIESKIDNTLEILLKNLSSKKIDKFDSEIKNGGKISKKVINDILNFKSLIDILQTSNFSYKLMDSNIKKFEEFYKSNKEVLESIKMSELKNEFNFNTSNELLKLKIQNKINNKESINGFKIDSEGNLVAPKYKQSYNFKDLKYVIEELDNNISGGINNDILSNIAMEIGRTTGGIKFIYEYLYTNKNFGSTDGTIDGRALVDGFAVSILHVSEELGIQGKRSGGLRGYIKNFINEDEIEEKIEKFKKEEK